MRILITGGAGYIGSHAARKLAERGHDVVIYDNLCSGHANLVQGFELIVGEISDRGKLGTALQGVEAIMHFAAHAYVGESVRNPRKYFQNNVVAGLQLLDATVDAHIPYFVFSSTCAVYGVPARLPITEDMPCLPVNPYGESKLFFEQALVAYEIYGLRSVRLRYFNATGADERGETGERHVPETHMVPLALQAAAGMRAEVEIYGDDYPTADGTCVRDYIDVNDVAEAHVLAINYLKENGESISLNLGTGRGYSVKELISCIEMTIGRRVPYRVSGRRPGDPPVLVADPTLAERTLGWKAKRSIEQTILAAWNWLSASSQRLEWPVIEPGVLGN